MHKWILCYIGCTSRKLIIFKNWFLVWKFSYRKTKKWIVYLVCSYSFKVLEIGETLCSTPSSSIPAPRFLDTKIMSWNKNLTCRLTNTVGLSLSHDILYIQKFRSSFTRAIIIKEITAFWRNHSTVKLHVQLETISAAKIKMIHPVLMFWSLKKNFIQCQIVIVVLQF